MQQAISHPLIEHKPLRAEAVPNKNLDPEVKGYFDKIFEEAQVSLDLDLAQIHQMKSTYDCIFQKCEALPQNVKGRVQCEFFGLGPLDALVACPRVTEVIINSYNNIWFEEGGGLKRLKDSFLSHITYTNFVLRLCQQSQVQTHLNQPFVDTMWRGFRVHIIQPPLVKGQVHMCLRRHPDSPWTLERLQEANWCTAQEADFLSLLVRDKKSLLIVGPTSTGKTSVMNALIQKIPHNERLLIIEDTDELSCPNAASVKLLTRTSGMGQLRDYLQDDLLKQALRMRPDRIAVGEARGSEAKDLLMAFATGHSGGFCTLHAQTAHQALYRLEMMIQIGAPQWSVQTVRKLIGLCVPYILVLENTKGSRRIKSIERVASLEPTGFCLERINCHEYMN